MPTTNNTFDIKAQATVFNNLPDNVRKSYAQLLYDKGLYNGPISGKSNIKLRNAFIKAQEAVYYENKNFNSKYDLATYLAQIPDASTGTGQPRRQKLIDIQITDPQSAHRLINAVISDQLGRKASAKELEKYTKMIQSAQANNPQVTTYEGINTQTRTTTGGADPQQLLIEQISGTDEAKANRASNFYSLFKQAIGVQ